MPIHAKTEREYKEFYAKLLHYLAQSDHRVEFSYAKNGLTVRLMGDDGTLIEERTLLPTMLAVCPSHEVDAFFRETFEEVLKTPAFKGWDSEDNPRRLPLDGTALAPRSKQKVPHDSPTS